MTAGTLAGTDFDFICSFVRERCAIVLQPGKEYLVEARLAQVVRHEGLDGLGALVEQLRRGAPALAERVVEAMTTNETSFFRDARPFDALASVVLPETIARRAPARRLDIWCAASSSGQEPYSVAMTIREQFPSLADWTVRILATDISNEMVEKARAGRYGALEVNRGLPAPYLVKYFERAGAGWRVKDDLRSMVEFRQLNLVGPWPTLPRMDVVFLRNVLIYFDADTKRQVLERVAAQLHPEGFLFLGAAETAMHAEGRFERLALERANCYRQTS